MDPDSVRPYVDDLLKALMMCFKDASWPVRDAACTGNVIPVQLLYSRKLSFFFKHAEILLLHSQKKVEDALMNFLSFGYLI